MWNFFEASHRKGALDGVGGALKRTTESLVNKGTDIPNATELFAVLQKTGSDPSPWRTYIQGCQLLVRDDTKSELCLTFSHQQMLPQPQKLNGKVLKLLANDVC